MIDDPIINEVRAIRDAFARAHHYDIDAIFDAIRALEAASGHEHVTLPPRRTAQQAAADRHEIASNGG